MWQILRALETRTILYKPFLLDEAWAVIAQWISMYLGNFSPITKLGQATSDFRWPLVRFPEGIKISTHICFGPKELLHCVKASCLSSGSAINRLKIFMESRRFSRVVISSGCTTVNRTRALWSPEAMEQGRWTSRQLQDRRTETVTEKYGLVSPWREHRCSFLWLLEQSALIQWLKTTRLLHYDSEGGSLTCVSRG